MKNFILIVYLIVISQSAIGANWVLSKASSKDDKETNYIDFDSVQGYYFNNYDKSSYYVTAWVRQDFNFDKILVNHGGKYRQRMDLWYIDCIAKKMMSSDMVFYGSNGKLVFNSSGYVSNYNSLNWHRIIPSSVGEQIANDVCMIYNFKLSSQNTK